MEQVEPRQDTLQALVDEPHKDVPSVIMIEEEPEEQVVPGSNTSKTLMGMEDTHFESLHKDMAFASLKHKEEGLHMGMRNKVTSFPIPWRTFPWMTTMIKTCTLEQKGALLVGDLEGEICDLTLDGSNALDKGGT